MSDIATGPSPTWGDEVVAILHEHTSTFWVLTVMFFVLGDLLTTGIGLKTGGVAEVGPLVGPILERYGLLFMFPLKFVAVAVCYGLWRLAPEPHDIGVPLGLAAFGVLVTSWNTGVLFVSFFLA